MAFLDTSWASGSQAGNALLLRGELLRHLLACEGEEDGRVIIDSFVARIEALIAGTPQAPLAIGSQSLWRYAMAQLCALRHGLDRLDAGEGRGEAAAA